MSEQYNSSEIPEITIEDIEKAAACRGMGPELFYAPDGEKEKGRNAREKLAVSVCARCDVRNPCGKWAIETGERDGVWGGMAERQLRELQRQRSQ